MHSEAISSAVSDTAHQIPLRSRDGNETLPRGLSRTPNLDFLPAEERRLLGRIQSLTSVYMLDFIEQSIDANPPSPERLPPGHEWWLAQGDPDPVFATDLPEGYEFAPRPGMLADALSAASRWAVLAFQHQIQSAARMHCVSCWDHEDERSPHQAALLQSRWEAATRCAAESGRLWRAEGEGQCDSERTTGVQGLAKLMSVLSVAVSQQAAADTCYFLRIFGRVLDTDQTRRLASALHAAYRWQYVEAGIQDPHFNQMLLSMTTSEHRRSLRSAFSL